MLCLGAPIYLHTLVLFCFLDEEKDDEEGARGGLLAPPPQRRMRAHPIPIANCRSGFASDGGGWWLESWAAMCGGFRIGREKVLQQGSAASVFGVFIAAAICLLSWLLKEEG